MHKKPFIIALLFLFIQQTAFAQPKQGQELIDSLLTELPKAKEDTGKVKLLNSLAYTSMQMNENDAALNYCKTAVALSKKLNFKKGQGNAFNIMGMASGNKGDYSQALNNYNMALKLRQEAGDKKGVAGTYNNIGIIHANQGNYPEALKMYFAALKINEEMDNKEWLANNYNNIGLVFRDQGNYSEALKMAFAALKIYETMGDKEIVASSYNNIGILYWTQKDYNGALNTYNKALKLLEGTQDSSELNHPFNNMAGIYADLGNYNESLKYYTISLRIREQMGDSILIADSYMGIGIINLKMNNYAESLKRFNAALKIYAQSGNKSGIASAYANIAEVYMALKSFSAAREFLDKAFVLYREIGNPESLYYAYETYAKLDSASGNFKGALGNYKQYVLYRDSSINLENSNKLVQSQMQYDFDKKEAATKAEQDIKDAVAKKELQRQKLVRNGFMGGFAIVMLFAGVFFTQRNKIKKGKKRSDELLLNILPEEVAEELKEKGSAEAKQFDEVTVMFTDFKGFTQISEKLSPSELVAEIHTCFKAFDEIISKYNIEKIKTIGDSYMCAGGLPVTNTTNATDVVKAAIEIQQFMQQHLQQRKNANKEVFEIRIGIHTGPVVAGIVGVKKFAYDIWGDTVNIASRMESSGEAGKVNISGSTYELVKDKFYCEYRGEIEAKGKGKVKMYFVEKSN